MPLRLKIIDDQATTLLVWDIKEEAEFFEQNLSLSPIYQKQIEAYSYKKKLEWLSTRFLLNYWNNSFSCEDLLKDEYGKPYLSSSNKHISISHSHSFASVIISDQIVGVDIQKLHNNIGRIAHKFIGQSEHAFIDPKDKNTHMHIIWGAKESMYKGYGKRKLRFIENMLVLPYQIGLGTTKFKGNVTKDNILENYNLKTRAIDDYILVYAIKE